MTETTSKNSIVQWQECSEDSMPEPALLVGAHMDCISISQGNDSILINYESLEELIKAIRAFAKQHKEGKLK